MRTVGVRLTADVSQYMTGLKRAGLATKDFAGALDDTAKRGKLDRVADSAVKFGVVGAAAFGYVVKSAADFDKQMSAVSAATHASSADMGRLREAALQAGKDTQFSATQAADGITQLSKAGVSTANILGGGLKGALSLAAAGQISVGEAAETAASAMTQFKLSGNQVPHVADLLAAAAGKAQGSVHDMGMALNQSGLVAAQFGLSIEDTTGVLAEFANAGLTGSDAGTSFKTMLLSMANPSQSTQALMEKLNISFYDAQGRFIGLSGVADVLRTKLGGLTEAQRNQALGQIFGNDAIRAAAILYKDGAAGVDKWKGAVNDAGYASETAAKLTDNLAGDLERLKGSLETLAIQSGSGSNSGLRVLAQGLNGLVTQFASMPPAVGSTITVLAGVGAAAALGLAAFIKLRKGLAEAVTQLTAMGPAGEKAAVGLQKTAGAAAKAGAAFAALEIGAAVFNSLDEKTTDVDRLTASLTNLANTGKSAGELNKAFGSNFDNLGRIATFADEANHGFGKFLNTTVAGIPIIGDAGKALGNFANRLMFGTDFDTAKQQMQSLDQALVNFMNTTQDAEQVNRVWRQVIDQSGLSVEELAKLLPNAWAQLVKFQAGAHGASGAANGLSGAAKGAAGGANALGTAAGDAKEKLDPLAAAEKAAAQAARGQRTALVDLSTALEAQFNPVLALIQAEKDFKSKQDAAAEAVKKHSRNSKEARAASLDLASAAINLTGKVGALGGSFDGKLSPAMRTALRNAGLTKRQIDDVASAFRTAKRDGDRFAKNYHATTSITGSKPVSDRLWALGEIQRGLKAGTLSATRNAYLHNVAQGRLAEGGPVPGRSPHKKADNVLIAATAGEYMQPVDAVTYYGTDFMDAVRSQRIPKDVAAQIAAYADGGLINMPYPVTASMTRVPSIREAEAAVIPAVPSGGQTWRWIIQAARALVGAVRVISTVRPGAHTLSGNLSYHAMGRAVDFAPSMQLARKWNITYGKRTLEEITPWRQYDLWHGRAHHYSAALHAQHSGGNAHVHIAMNRGGMLREPVIGYGTATGHSYSFAENGPEGVIPQQYLTGGGSTTVINVTLQNNAPIGSQLELDNWLVGSIDRLRYRVRV